MSLKIELWAVLLIVLLGMVAAMGFGFAAVDGERGAKRFGALSKTALFVAEIPDTVKAAMKDQNRMQVYDSGFFDGWATGWATRDGSAMPKLDGYLLLSRYDGTLQRPVVELTSMADWQVKHRWVIESDQLLGDFTHVSHHAEFTNWDSRYYRAIHPYLTPAGDLIFKDHTSPLLSVNACGARNWIIRGKLFHHSTEPDGDGNLWVPSVVEPTTIPKVDPGFFEDEITQVSPTGQVLFTRSVPQMMLDHGLDYLLFTNGRYSFDPTHLNDIEPVLADGPFWRKGDLFLSLRNISAIVLYRPSTDKIIWMKEGPWVAQHDVDILDDHTIAVYDNRAEDRGGPRPFVDGHSDIAVFDFATGQVSTILDQVMADEHIQTIAAGQYNALPGGYHLIEDVTHARFVLADPAQKFVAEFTNRAENGKVYQLGWSRFVTNQQGDAALSAMKGVDCNE